MPTSTSPSPPALELDTAARLRASVAKLSRRLRPTAAGAAARLTPTRISVLFTIRRLGPIRLSELAEEEGLNPTMLSRVIADFADSGLVTRVSDPDDRRAAVVQVTAEGRELCERMQGERTDVLELALGALADADRRAVELALPVLEELAHGLKGRRG